MFAKMVIGECLSEAEFLEFAKIYENDLTGKRARRRRFAAARRGGREHGHRADDVDNTGGLPAPSLVEKLPSVRR